MSIRAAITGEVTQVNPAPPDKELSVILKDAAGIARRPQPGSLDEFLEKADWPVERDEDIPGPLLRLKIAHAYEEATRSIRQKGVRTLLRQR